MSQETAKYRVLRLSHINNNLWPEGSEVEYDGEPGSALEPLNEAAKAAKKKAESKGKGQSAQAVVPNPSSQQPGEVDNPGDDDLDKLREEYEALFNDKPHHNTKAETLREKIAEKRKELGL
ncbi:hypothetical protein [Pantoea sp. GM01]|uniref:hypothetical protein n=1 Tax=Pantoea sp. GM01 TaxID=1144320 RepID=UPI0002710773|nr:hypothetical protein [Pantoea sp. GM01]EJL90269.1 hypothetical protein PMI17_01789 [Pantoea sp. GM01]